MTWEIFRLLLPCDTKKMRDFQVYKDLQNLLQITPENITQTHPLAYEEFWKNYVVNVFRVLVVNKEISQRY